MTKQTQTILLIDDEQPLLFGLSAILKRAGYETLTANNGQEGLRLAKEHHPSLIVCDVNMPGINGFSLRDSLSQQPNNSSIPFIYLTSHGSLSDKVRGLELGADDYIIKPVKRAELVARIKAVLRRVELEQEKARIKAETEMQEFMREIQRNISHELRTPLHIVLTDLQWALRKRFNYQPKRKERFIKRMLNSTQQLSTIITDLLFLSQLENTLETSRPAFSLERELYPVVEKCMQHWQDREERDVNLKMTIDEELVIHAPAHAFRLAVRHLLDNACKFGPENGTIELSVAKNGRGGCIVTVTDEGAGIAEELREKVFERFFQASQGYSRMYDGLGLGLFITRAFARSLGGDVVILDTKKGCQVQMTIPPLKEQKF